MFSRNVVVDKVESESAGNDEALAEGACLPPEDPDNHRQVRLKSANLAADFDLFLKAEGQTVQLEAKQADYRIFRDCSNIAGVGRDTVSVFCYFSRAIFVKEDDHVGAGRIRCGSDRGSYAG